MMCTSKQFNKFIKFIKIYCPLALSHHFAGSEAASGRGGGNRGMALAGDGHNCSGHRHCAVQAEEARCSYKI